jgi:protein gp37
LVSYTLTPTTDPEEAAVAADKSGIEWTEATWNPVTGCSKVSPGCAHCYAETLSLRFGTSARAWTPENASLNVVCHGERLAQPLRWRRPRVVFVNSMSDLFHELVSFDFIDRVFAVMNEASHHTFQVLTKRPERMRDYMAVRYVDDARAPANVWLGVSIENSRFGSRADLLRQTPAAVRFISAEPLLGSLLDVSGGRKPLDLERIDWVIAGGESGTRARPMDIRWARELRDACAHAGVPFFFKQWGGKTAKAGGRTLDDEVHDAMPQLGAQLTFAAAR